MVKAEGGSLRFWGPGLLSTSPAFSMSSASHSAGSSGWLAQKTGAGPTFQWAGKVDAICRSRSERAKRPRAGCIFRSPDSVSPLPSVTRLSHLTQCHHFHQSPDSVTPLPSVSPLPSVARLSVATSISRQTQCHHFHQSPDSVSPLPSVTRLSVTSPISHQTQCCCCCCRPHSTNVLPAESSTRNHVAASSLSPQVARKGSTLSGFVQRSRLEREVGRDLHSNKWEEV